MLKMPELGAFDCILQARCPNLGVLGHAKCLNFGQTGIGPLAALGGVLVIPVCLASPRGAHRGHEISHTLKKRNVQVCHGHVTIFALFDKSATPPGFPKLQSDSWGQDSSVVGR